jgi:mRNA interferase RelE/StbE
MGYKVEFLPEAAEEFDSLDGSLKKLAAKQIDKIKENPDLGEPLGKRLNIDLSGYRKVYFSKKQYRIVYEVQKNTITVLIVGIGRREKLEVYQMVAKRITGRR